MGKIFLATNSSKWCAVNHWLPQATLSHGSPFQNGGDLDHLGSVAFEQICGIGFRMFSLRLLIKMDHSVVAFMNHMDVDFMCLHLVICAQHSSSDSISYVLTDNSAFL